MRTEVKEAGRFERVITVELDGAELEDAKNRAARKLSKELKIKGFRPGKAPRQVVERMVGADALRAEAIEDSLPGFVGTALEESELRPVTTPRVADVRDRDDGGVEVDVEVILWPQLEAIPDFTDREVVVELGEVTDNEMEEQLERFRSQYAELEDVQRASDEGDFVLVNITTLAAGKEIEAASTTDLLYEVGSRSFIPGLDELLVGCEAGAIKEGPGVLPEGFGDHAGENVTLRLLVKGVKARKLPELTDEWVADVTELDTVEELTEEVHESLASLKILAARADLQDQLIEDLRAEIDIDLPEQLIAAEMDAQARHFLLHLQEQGVDLSNYLRITGQTEEEFIADLRQQAETGLETRILLESVIAIEGLEVTEEELDGAVSAIVESSGEDPAESRAALQASGQVQAIAGDILRRKALERLVESAKPVDSEGSPVDLTPEPVEEAEEDEDTDDAGASAEAGSPETDRTDPDVEE